MIDASAFSPFSALLGGGLIGLSAALLMLGNGKIAGVSGIFGGLVAPQSTGRSTLLWQAVFILGLVIGAWIAARLGLIDGQIRPVASLPLILVAGVLVGAGTRFGAGCTSGHGICGMSRFSPRSIIAVLVFMATGFATASLMGALS